MSNNVLRYYESLHSVAAAVAVEPHVCLCVKQNAANSYLW